MNLLPDMTDYMPTKDGFCRPDWREIWKHIKEHVPEAECEVAWHEIARRWVTELARQFGATYRVHETPNFFIVPDASDRIARDACKSSEEMLNSLRYYLAAVLPQKEFGKRVVLMLPEVEQYYHYISHFYSEGEHPTSGGICIRRSGYIHFVFNTMGYHRYRGVLVHEMAHGILTHLRLSRWIDEALAMRMEQVICGTSKVRLDHELLEKHFGYWNSETIQTFWSGESWRIPGESFTLHYGLTQIIWRKIEVDYQSSRDKLMRFIGTAKYTDAGEAACKEVIGVSLGDLVADFLGKGDWKPNPEKWPK